MKRLLCFVLVMVMVGWFVPMAFAQDQMGVGGIWVKGAHSDSGEYAMENEGSNGWGVFAHYDHDADWTLWMKKNWEIGVDPGMSYHYIRWTKSHNKEREVCEFKKWRETDNIECQGYGCKTEQYRDNEQVNSQILAFTLKPYLQIKDDFRLFTVGGAGMEVADDGEDNFAVYGGIGAQYFFTKNLGLSVQMQEVYSNPTGDYRRWDLVVSAIEYRW